MFRIAKKFIFPKQVFKRYIIEHISFEQKISNLLEKNKETEAENLLNIMIKENIIIRDINYYNFLIYYCFHGKEDKLEKLLRELDRINFEKTTPFYNILLKFYLNKRKKKEFEYLINEMKIKKVEMSYSTFKIYLTYFFKLQEFEKFQKVYQQMENKGYSLKGIIFFYIGFNKFELVEKEFRRFISLCDPLDIQKILTYYLNQGKRKEYFELIKDSKKEIDATFYLTSFHHYIRTNQLKNCEELLNEMYKNNIKLDDKSYVIILKYIGSNSEKYIIFRFIDYIGGVKQLKSEFAISVHLSIMVRFKYSKIIENYVNEAINREIILENQDYNMLIRYFINMKNLECFIKLLKFADANSIGLTKITIEDTISYLKNLSLKEEIHEIKQTLIEIMNYVLSILVYSKIPLETTEILKVFMFYFNLKLYHEIEKCLTQLTLKNGSIFKEFKNFDQIMQTYKENTSQESLNKVLKIFNYKPSK